MNKNILALLVIFMSAFSGFIGSIIWNWFDFSDFITKNNTETKIQKSTIVDLQNEIISVWENLSDSVVSIIVKKDLTLYRRNPFWAYGSSTWTVSQEISSWTWFFIDKEWTILTNKHVINNNWDDYIVVTNSWNEYPAEILWIDELNDLAVIKIKADFETPAVQLINSIDEVKIGQFAVAIWNALSKFQNTTTLWIVSWKNRTIEIKNEEKLNNLIQTDAAINPGNSGWPLVNIEWKVIWINTAISGDANWIWFSIPLSKNKVEYIKNSIEKYGKIKRPYIWVVVVPINNYTKADFNISVDYGNYINEIDPQSNAKSSWLKVWDIILEANSEKLINKNLSDIIQNKIPWDKLDLKIYRDSEIKNIELIIWEL